MPMTGTHDLLLVLLSILIAVFASYTALDLAARMLAARGFSRIAWLVTASVALGGGVWSMHFVAMLAFSLPAMTMSYDLWLTLLSALAPTLCAGLGFAIMVRSGKQPLFLALAGLTLGLGITAMHYLGMAAMQMPAKISYIPLLFILSVAVAISAATVALWIAFQATDLLQKILAAGVMGIAIAGMHYTAMAAAIFTMQIEGAAPAVVSQVSIDPVRIALLVAASTFAVLFLSLLAALYDRRYALLAERQARLAQASEHQFRELYRASPLPLMALDTNLLMKQVSDDWLELFGYAREQVLGRPLSAFMTHASGQLWNGQHAARLQAGQEIRYAEHQFQRQGGAIVDALLSARMERDASGQIVQVLGGLIDVTERRVAEQALRQAQKMETVGQLTGGIAHDFNNLLMVVIGNLEGADRAVRTGLFVKAQRNIEVAMSGAKRAVGLTQRLLDFSRPQPLRPNLIDLNQSVAGMMELFQRTLGGSITIESKLAADLWPVRVDANQLENALLNLVINARDATNGGGAVIVQTQNAAPGSGPATRPDAPPGRYVAVSVIDAGKGIPPEVLAKVLEPFFTTKDPGQGTGLGLAMVHGFVKQSGGEIVIDSVPDKGTVVTLYLPGADPGDASDPAADAEDDVVRRQPSRASTRTRPARDAGRL